VKLPKSLSNVIARARAERDQEWSAIEELIRDKNTRDLSAILAAATCNHAEFIKCMQAEAAAKLFQSFAMLVLAEAAERISTEKADDPH